MIGRIQGKILEKIPPHILIDCNGVGYEIEVPMTTFYDLPEVGNEVVLLTHFLVREDAQLLFGFATDQERIIFRKLLKVNGIGAKASLSILGGMTTNELTHSIQTQDVNSLIKIPGVGKKTAERLILELKDKFSDTEFASSKHISLRIQSKGYISCYKRFRRECFSK
jgi:Holliday junction DNA helicase RuvA